MDANTTKFLIDIIHIKEIVVICVVVKIVEGLLLNHLPRMLSVIYITFVAFQ